MDARRQDGSAGDVDYGTVGAGYSAFRAPDPRIAKAIEAALGEARTVIKIGAGAGAGSYEPIDREVTAIEPSAAMRDQRPPHLTRAIDGVAERLPFADRSFDASMAIFTVHQWSDLAARLFEMRRVTRGPAVVMGCDPDALDRMWLTHYAPEVIETEARRYPSLEAIAAGLGGDPEVVSLPIPLDCVDRFNEAYYGRPEGLLDPNARLACSAWSFVPPEAVARFEAGLRRDLADGSWDRRWGALRDQPSFVGSLRLVVSRPVGAAR